MPEEKNIRGLIFNIKKYAIHDGPGIRTTVFLKGCPLKCLWCHNPEGMSFSPQILKKIIRRSDEKSGEKTLLQEEIIGREISVPELIAEIEKDRIFYDESGGGVTFSGGEPLAQAPFLKAVLEKCRQKEIHSAIDTSGYAPADTLSEIADFCDLFLYDLKIMNDEKHRAYTGVSNRGILRNLNILSQKGKEMMIRLPLIPGYTDGKENIREIIDHLSALPNIREIALLPFHNTAEGKYRKLENRNPMKGMIPPDTENTEKVRREFESRGFSVIIGG